MRRRRVLVGAVGIAAALAGCNERTDGSGSSSGSPDGIEEVTPVPLPEDEELLAPGLTAGGIVDPDALAGAHRQAMYGVSHESQRATVVRDDEGVIRDQRVRITATAEAGRLRREFAVEDTERYPNTPGVDRSDFWFDGNVGIIREGDDDPNYRRLDQPYDSAALSTTDSNRLGALFFGFADGRVVDPDSETNEPYRFTASGSRRRSSVLPEWLGELSEPRDEELDARIGSDGRVHEYRLTFTATVDERTVSVEHVSEYAIEVSVEEPEWLDEARREV